MSRLYFTDPIVALYMMQHFDVRIEIYSSLEDEFTELHFDNLACEITNEGKEQYYVHETSESIFELKKNDLVIGSYPDFVGDEIILIFGAEIYGSRTVLWQHPPITIMRDGKHFFQPLKED